MTVEKNPFSKTREDHANETAEDYVEAILRISNAQTVNGETPEARTTEIADALNVAQPTATKILNRLEREGFVQIEPRKGVALTEKGRELAQLSLQRHELVVRFLIKIGVSEMQANLDAEGIEHHLSDESIDAIKQFLQD